MTDYINKGDDYLSAEETIGYLLDRLGVIGKNESGNAIITKDVVIEVRLRRSRMTLEEKGVSMTEEQKNCTDCKHFGMCWLRRHKDNDEPCEDFEVEEWEKDECQTTK